MPNPLDFLFGGAEPNRGEFERFKEWLRAQGYTEQAVNITLGGYRNNRLYSAWKSQVAAQPTAPASVAPTPTGEAELTPEEYIAGVRKIWWEDPNFDNATIDEQEELLRAYVEQYGFNIYAPGYAAVLDYKNSRKEQGFDIVVNWEGKGYDVEVDALGNKKIIAGSALDETRMTAWQKAQYDIDLKQFGLTEESLAFQKQQAQTQTQYQQAQTNLQQMQEASRLAGLGEEGWIEKWYAEQAQQAKFPTEGPGLTKENIENMWAGMSPDTRAWALDRYGDQLNPAEAEALQRGFTQRDWSAYGGARPTITGQQPETFPTAACLSQVGTHAKSDSVFSSLGSTPAAGGFG